VIDLNLVKTIVIVMLENRSFDHMLGYLSLPRYAAAAGPANTVDGLKGTPKPDGTIEEAKYQNPDQKGLVHFPFLLSKDPELPSDLAHGRRHVGMQLAHNAVVGGYAMNGFVKAHRDYKPEHQTLRPEPMGMMVPGLVPTTDFFARNFAVCDRWFTPVPTDTHPNRLVALTGTTRVDNTDFAGKFDGYLGNETVLDWMNRNNVRWRVYSGGMSFLLLVDPKLIADPRMRKLKDFATDFQNEADAAFPQVIIVEPNYRDDPLEPDPCDNHPPLPVAPGENFLRRVYQALRSNPGRWKSTMMIVTYDEHGGFYDHVPPLDLSLTAPAGANYPTFTSTGPRVPGLIVSPLVSPGTVFHGNLDHTSMLRFLAEKFTPGKPYSPDVAARHADTKGKLESVGAVLNLSKARDDQPPLPPAVQPSTPLSPGIRPAETPGQKIFQAVRLAVTGANPQRVADLFPEFKLPTKPPGA
jgi:phospholipase C